MTPIVRLKKNGNYWQAYWTLEGERAARSLGNRKKVSKSQAEQIVLKLQRNMDNNFGSQVDFPLLQVGQLYDWISEMKPDVTKSTRETYRYTVDTLVTEFGPSKVARDITPLDAARWSTSLGKKYAYNSIRAHVRRVKSIWNTGIKAGIFPSCPFAELVGRHRADKSIPYDLPDPKDVEAIIERACDLGKFQLARTLGLAYYTGLRRCEIPTVTPGIIDDDGKIHLNSPKTGPREVKIEQGLVDIARRGALISVVRPDTPFVRRPIKNIHLEIRKIGQPIGIKEWPKPLQALRRLRAIAWREKYPGWIVDQWMGHSMEVARENYLEVPSRYYESH